MLARRDKCRRSCCCRRQSRLSLLTASNTASDPKRDVGSRPHLRYIHSSSDAAVPRAGPMRRCELIEVVVGLAVTWPLGARDQRQESRLNGVPSSRSADHFAKLIAAFSRTPLIGGLIDSANAWPLISSDSTPHLLRRVCPPSGASPHSPGRLQVSTKPRLGQIEAAGAENRDGTEATLCQEPKIFPFGPFPSTWTAQHV